MSKKWFSGLFAPNDFSDAPNVLATEAVSDAVQNSNATQSPSAATCSQISSHLFELVLRKLATIALSRRFITTSSEAGFSFSSQPLA